MAFVDLVDEQRIGAAVASLSRPLGVTDLSGRTFLDVGCGSGLFSLAAQRLGARVHSFDYDAESVAATEALRRRYGAGDGWTVEQGSVLDEAYVDALGRFDVVYSWGVLHHTGDLWRALAAVARPVAPGGLLFISIYNDQGLRSRVWREVKRRYNTSGPVLRRALLIGTTLYFERPRPLRGPVRRLVGIRDEAAPAPRARGMSKRHDLVDWVGGYPFEVARPEEVFTFFRDRGFELRHLLTSGGGIGCNEYVFERGPTGRPAPDPPSPCPSG